MSTVYERVVDGRVVERVQPVPNDYEDNRLGVAAIDQANGWRVAGEEVPAPTETPADNPSVSPADDPVVAAFLGDTAEPAIFEGLTKALVNPPAKPPKE